MGLKNIQFGNLQKGRRDLITDVPGVKVGHVTLSDGPVQTGVTALIPGDGSTFRNKFPAAAHVINGFGKSAGLIQVQELGTLETPVLLTNTLSVAACLDGLITYMLKDHPEIGTTTGTVNPVVMECNDSKLNDIRGRHVRPEHALKALSLAAEDFEEGACGAGRGMKCYGWKGGIGSASRIVPVGGKEYTMGALLLTNFGKKDHFIINGKKAGNGRRDAADDFNREDTERESGSCIMILATDLPLSDRQLLRCAHRAQNGLARTGAQTGGGSGEIVVAFSTANRIPHDPAEPLQKAAFLHEDLLDIVFTAAADCVEESVVSSIFHAETVTGRDGYTLEGFLSNPEALPESE